MYEVGDYVKVEWIGVSTYYLTISRIDSEGIYSNTGFVNMTRCGENTFPLYVPPMEKIQAKFPLDRCKITVMKKDV